MTRLSNRAKTPEPSGLVDPWLWAFCLNIDAPLVAVAWQELFAGLHGVVLRPADRVLLFLAVWAIYTVDRLLDVASGAAPKTLRHAAHAKFRSVLFVALGVAILSGPFLAFQTLNTKAWLGTLLLGAASLAHLLATAGGELFGRAKPWKELRVGLVFALGCQLIPWSRGGFSMLNPSLLFFAGLCVTNCRLIELWEQSGSSAPSNKWGWVALALALGGAVGLLSAWGHDAPAREFASAVLLGGLALWGISRSPGLGSETRRGLADVALMSPFLIIIWG